MTMLALFVGMILPFLAKAGVLFLGFTGYSAQSLYKVFQLAVPCVWRYRQGARGVRIFWPVEEPLPSWKIWSIGTLISVILAGSAIVATITLAPLWELDPHILRQGFDARFTVGPVAAVIVVLFLSFLNSALEELHFRAWLDQELSQIAGNVIGIGISAMAFGGMHMLIFFGLPDLPLILIALAAIGLAIGGVCWSLLMRQPGGIHAAWWSHGLTDALLLGWGLHWLGYV